MDGIHPNDISYTVSSELTKVNVPRIEIKI